MAKAKIKRERLEEPEEKAPAPNYGARASKVSMCEHCGHHYIRPCINSAMLAKCSNYQWLKTQRKEKKK